jgi:hypothetical protein
VYHVLDETGHLKMSTVNLPNHYGFETDFQQVKYYIIYKLSPNYIMYYKKFDFLIQYMKITNNEKLFEKIE